MIINNHGECRKRNDYFFLLVVLKNNKTAKTAAPPANPNNAPRVPVKNNTKTDRKKTAHSYPLAVILMP